MTTSGFNWSQQGEKTDGWNPIHQPKDVEDPGNENHTLLRKDAHRSADTRTAARTTEESPVDLHSFESNRSAFDTDLETFMENMDLRRKAWWIIYPDTTMRRIWLQVTLVIALYIVWVTPIRVGYNMQSQGFFFWMEGLMNLFFLVDLILNFFLAYEHPATSEVITDHKLIAQRYVLSGWFWVDLLATFPSDFIIKALEGTFVCSVFDSCYYVVPQDINFGIIVLLRCMRFFRIIWIIKNFHVISVRTILGKVRDELLDWGWLISVFEILIILMIMAHVAGCFFYMFGLPMWQTHQEKQLIEEGLMTTWILDKIGTYELVTIPVAFDPNSTTDGRTEVLDARYYAQDPVTSVWYICPLMSTITLCMECAGPHFRCEALHGFTFRYTTATYWAYTTMTTVGYGDICGDTIAEKIWAIVSMVLGGFFLSFCFGRCAVIVGRLDANNAARADQLEQITEFIKDVELPKTLARKVMDFSRSSVKSIKPYDRAAVLTRLPFDLRTKIMHHLYLATIKRIPILQKHADDEVFLTDMCTRLQLYHCSADTYVYLKGESSSELYILTHGDMYIMGADRKSRLLKVPEGTVFGENVVIRKLDGEVKATRKENVFCHSECDMLYLSADDLMYLCEINERLAHDIRRLDKARQSKLQKLTNRKSAPRVVQTLTRLADLPEEEGERISATSDTITSTSPSHYAMEAALVSAAGGLVTLPNIGGSTKGLPPIPETLPESASVDSFAYYQSIMLSEPSEARFGTQDSDTLSDELAKMKDSFELQMQSLRDEVMLQREMLKQLPQSIARLIMDQASEGKQEERSQ